LGWSRLRFMGDVVPAELTQVDRGRIQAAGGEFDPEVVYLNTATLGLPPRCCLTAVQAPGPSTSSPATSTHDRQQGRPSWRAVRESACESRAS